METRLLKLIGASLRMLLLPDAALSGCEAEGAVPLRSTACCSASDAAATARCSLFCLPLPFANADGLAAAAAVALPALCCVPAPPPSSPLPATALRDGPVVWTGGVCPAVEALLLLPVLPGVASEERGGCFFFVVGGGRGIVVVCTCFDVGCW